MAFLTAERKAILIGKIDATLTVLFAAVGFAATQLFAWVLQALPGITTSDWGKWNWAKVPVAIAVAAFLKGLDRKKHEDTSTQTGLIEVPKALTGE